MAELSLTAGPVSLEPVQVVSSPFQKQQLLSVSSASLATLPRAVDGRWSEWTEWSECDAGCGGGVSQRNRTCSAPPPKNGGRDCEGRRLQTQSCHSAPCSHDAGADTGEPPHL